MKIHTFILKVLDNFKNFHLVSGAYLEMNNLESISFMLCYFFIQISFNVMKHEELDFAYGHESMLMENF